MTSRSGKIVSSTCASTPLQGLIMVRDVRRPGSLAAGLSVLLSVFVSVFTPGAAHAAESAYTSLAARDAERAAYDLYWRGLQILPKTLHAEEIERAEVLFDEATAKGVAEADFGTACAILRREDATDSPIPTKRLPEAFEKAKRAADQGCSRARPYWFRCTGTACTSKWIAVMPAASTTDCDNA
jgi:hypothetical protein